MAVDTRDKRFSMIGLGSPVPSVLPNPDGTIAAADRAMLLWLYHGISLAAAAVLAVDPDNVIYILFRDRRVYEAFRDRRIIVE